ncbi:hypothetical protein LHV56_12050 [Peribacillus frigoritolerans]|uniref:hypothetical protein n=1 Tax=Peribacillus frigoritolerans TaxID=450367 RepID=UPI00207AAC5A|nr:hypothetical protein [Peribacillus frigoritolerans]USK82565.1 hypothetical protein LHV56_12050 [Peribacillus frigoritolerans]
MSKLLSVQELALRSHDISIGLGNKVVPDFESLPQVGQMVRLALHIRGLPRIEYDILRLVAYHYLQISPSDLRNIVKDLAEVEFIRIFSEGETYKAILPTVPYYDEMYTKIGEYTTSDKKLNEAEQLAITVLDKLTKTPVAKQSLIQIGADAKLLERSLNIGIQGNYLITKRVRGKDIVLSPVFFSENIDTYADLVAKSGATNIQRLLKLIEGFQGVPLHIIQTRKEINGTKLTDEEILLLKRLASDGAVKPPSIATSHAGVNHFLFTPKPGIARLTPAKREIFERAMALVSAVRQGQFLPKKYAIRSPYAILSKLKNSDDGLKANTEAYEQYKKLTVMRVGRLEPTIAGGWHIFKINKTEENIAALNIALDLVDTGGAKGLEIDDEARIALGQDQTYVESLIGSKQLREQEYVPLSEEHQYQMDNLFLGGA